ncbi:TIGR01666 family membrane protein, partial [Enterobacter hormaechei]|nr:TIGR01666 family membrane protein [Enterobacter hormaechei]
NAADTLLPADILNVFSDMWRRLSRLFPPEPALFRQGVRMSLVLCVGSAFIKITGFPHGYWTLLPSLFVCQPN